MAAKKTGFYHALHTKPKELSVLKENADGTVNLGTEEGVLVVGKCPVAEAPMPGHFTFGKLPETAVETEKKTETKTE